MPVPRELLKKHDDISKMIVDYCQKYLNKEYEEICLRALEQLCCKRPCPLRTGRVRTWAAGIIYAIGSINFIFDKDQPIHMSSKELTIPLGVGVPTASSKSTIIKKALKINYYQVEWSLSSVIENNLLLWMVSKNVRTYDARTFSVEAQKRYFEKGLIPYVMTDKNKKS